MMTSSSGRGRTAAESCLLRRQGPHNSTDVRRHAAHRKTAIARHGDGDGLGALVGQMGLGGISGGDGLEHWWGRWFGVVEMVGMIVRGWEAVCRSASRSPPACQNHHLTAPSPPQKHHHFGSSQYPRDPAEKIVIESSAVTLPGCSNTFFCYCPLKVLLSSPPPSLQSKGYHSPQEGRGKKSSSRAVQ